MISGRNPSPRVRDFFQEYQQTLQLEPLLKTAGFSRSLTPSPSRSDFSPVVIWGEKEFVAYDGLPREKKEPALRSLWKGAACVVLIEGISPGPEILNFARENNLSIFRSGRSRETSLRVVHEFVAQLTSDRVIVPGGLLNIFDTGVLIVGDSGIGKSESALELISRGYTFISDDVTLISKEGDGRLVGRSPDLSRNFMEVRGLGIINIERIFGPRAISARSFIDLVIQLKRWEEGRDYDRLGLEFPEDYTLLDVRIPRVSLPVGPGRNISTLIEVACKVYICRRNGYSAPRDLMKRLDRVLSDPQAEG